MTEISEDSNSCEAFLRRSERRTAFKPHQGATESGVEEVTITSTTSLSTSRRKTREKSKAKNYKDGKKGKVRPNLYNEHGVLKANGLDLCDCMVTECPGCHFPCPKCSSTRCGAECRQNRKWQYETAEYDGVPNSGFKNEYLVEPITKGIAAN